MRDGFPSRISLSFSNVKFNRRISDIGFKTWYKPMMNTNTLHLTQKDFKHIWNHLKASAKKRNIPFELSPSDIDEIGIPITCPILGMPLVFHRNMAEDDSISFDRIDSTKGYTVDNLIVISHRANKLKSNASLDEMRKIVSFYEQLMQPA